MKEILTVIADALQEGENEIVEAKTVEALANGLTPFEVLHNGLLYGMNIMGEKWKNEEVYMPEVLIAAQAMHAGMNILKPYLIQAGIEPIGKVVLGTVKGDLHDIGKNLVNMMFVGAGMEVIDLGVDVHEDTFIEAIKEHKPQILAMSALLTTTMSEMRVVIDSLIGAGVREQVKVMVGGAPVTENFAQRIGADAYALDAAVAADVARQMMIA